MINRKSSTGNHLSPLHDAVITNDTSIIEIFNTPVNNTGNQVDLSLYRAWIANYAVSGVTLANASYNRVGDKYTIDSYVLSTLHNTDILYNLNADNIFMYNIEGDKKYIDNLLNTYKEYGTMTKLITELQRKMTFNDYYSMVPVEETFKPNMLNFAGVVKVTGTTDIQNNTVLGNDTRLLTNFTKLIGAGDRQLNFKVNDRDELYILIHEIDVQIGAVVPKYIKVTDTYTNYGFRYVLRNKDYNKKSFIIPSSYKYHTIYVNIKYTSKLTDTTNLTYNSAIYMDTGIQEVYPGDNLVRHFNVNVTKDTSGQDIVTVSVNKWGQLIRSGEYMDTPNNFNYYIAEVAIV